MLPEAIERALVALASACDPIRVGQQVASEIVTAVEERLGRSMPSFLLADGAEIPRGQTFTASDGPWHLFVGWRSKWDHSPALFAVKDGPCTVPGFPPLPEQTLRLSEAPPEILALAAGGELVALLGMVESRARDAVAAAEAVRR